MKKARWVTRHGLSAYLGKTFTDDWGYERVEVKLPYPDKYTKELFLLQLGSDSDICKQLHIKCGNKSLDYSVQSGNFRPELPFGEYQRQFEICAIFQCEGIGYLNSRYRADPDSSFVLVGNHYVNAAGINLCVQGGHYIREKATVSYRKHTGGDSSWSHAFFKNMQSQLTGEEQRIIDLTETPLAWSYRVNQHTGDALPGKSTWLDVFTARIHPVSTGGMTVDWARPIVTVYDASAQLLYKDDYGAYIRYRPMSELGNAPKSNQETADGWCACACTLNGTVDGLQFVRNHHLEWVPSYHPMEIKETKTVSFTIKNERKLDLK